MARRVGRRPAPTTTSPAWPSCSASTRSGRTRSCRASTCSASSTCRSRTTRWPSPAGTSPASRPIVWGNDYPHAEGTFRGSQELLTTQFAGVPDDERKAMVGGTLGEPPRLRGPGGRSERAPLRRAASPSSPARDAASAAPMPACSPSAGRQRRRQRPRRLDGRATAPTPSRLRHVAAEIVAAGGAAIADTSDVATTAGAQALVDAAVERFGRVDILVNNAGIMRWAGFPEADARRPRRPPRRARRSARSTPPAPRGRTWSSRATAASS